VLVCQQLLYVLAIHMLLYVVISYYEGVGDQSSSVIAQRVHIGVCIMSKGLSFLWKM
jgi:hypothetical protein